MTGVPPGPLHRVLIIDDISLYRQTLASALEAEPSIDAVATAADTDAALFALADGAGDYVVLVNMAMADSVGVLSAIVRAVPSAPMIALAVSETDDDVIACAEAGAAGYLLRGDSLADLVATIASAARGEARCSPRVAATLLRRVATLAMEHRRQAVPAQLTPREREVLQLIDEGLSNKQIARRLSIELRTVKNHVHNILEKFQVHRRHDAAARFRTDQQSR